MLFLLSSVIASKDTRQVEGLQVRCNPGHERCQTFREEEGVISAEEVRRRCQTFGPGEVPDGQERIGERTPQEEKRCQTFQEKKA